MRWFRRRLGRDASVEEPPQERTDPELAAEEFWRGWYELLPRISAALGEREPHRIEYELTELVARIHPDLQRSEEHTSELQSREDIVCRLLLDKKRQRISGS